jgi:hypothetical protein
MKTPKINKGRGWRRGRFARVQSPPALGLATRLHADHGRHERLIETLSQRGLTQSELTELIDLRIRTGRARREVVG